jgi:hypothetical protein
MTHKSGECSELTQNAARNEKFRGIKLQQLVLTDLQSGESNYQQLDHFNATK